MRDGQGNLVASDGRLYAPVHIFFGRDYLRGPRAWSFGLRWGLDNNAGPGCSVYRREAIATVYLSIR